MSRNPLRSDSSFENQALHLTTLVSWSVDNHVKRTIPHWLPTRPALSEIGIVFRWRAFMAQHWSQVSLLVTLVSAFWPILVFYPEAGLCPSVLAACPFYIPGAPAPSRLIWSSTIAERRIAFVQWFDEELKARQPERPITVATIAASHTVDELFQNIHERLLLIEETLLALGLERTFDVESYWLLAQQLTLQEIDRQIATGMTRLHLGKGFNYFHDTLNTHAALSEGFEALVFSEALQKVRRFRNQRGLSFERYNGNEEEAVFRRALREYLEDQLTEKTKHKVEEVRFARYGSRAMPQPRPSFEEDSKEPWRWLVRFLEEFNPTMIWHIVIYYSDWPQRGAVLQKAFDVNSRQAVQKRIKKYLDDIRKRGYRINKKVIWANG